MDNKIRYTLGREERLKSRKAIEHLFKEGRSVTLFPFRVLYIVGQEQDSLNKNGLFANAGPMLRAGFTVSSRHFKKAVDRNHIKRLMREAYRLQKNELQSILDLRKNNLSLFFIYVGKERPQYPWVYEKTALILKRFTKLILETR